MFVPTRLLHRASPRIQQTCAHDTFIRRYRDIQSNNHASEDRHATSIRLSRRNHQVTLRPRSRGLSRRRAVAAYAGSIEKPSVVDVWRCGYALWKAYYPLTITMVIMLPLHAIFFRLSVTDDVKRGQNLEAEARATRPRTRPISGG